MKIARQFVIAALLSIALGAPVLGEESPRPQPSPPVAWNAGSLSVQLDAKANMLVVADSSRQTLGIYYVDNSQVRLVGVRHLDRDFSGEPAKDPSPAPLPTKDAPGQDPPDFRRPKNLIRSLSEYQAEIGPSEQWNTIYVAPGTIADVFSQLRTGFKDWKLVIENGGGLRGSQLKVTRDKTSLELAVTSIASSPGWVEVRVTEMRPRG
jgi:hypothetical protein